MQRLGFLLATCGPVGYVPVASGTFGAAVGLLVWTPMVWAGSPAIEAATIALLLVVGTWGSTIAERRLGIDPAPVVIDEVVGMLVTLAFIDLSALGVFVGFLVFRVLDIVKPWPADRFERLPGGVGIMADDVMAGVYGNLLLRGAVALAPAWLA